MVMISLHADLAVSIEVVLVSTRSGIGGAEALIAGKFDVTTIEDHDHACLEMS